VQVSADILPPEKRGKRMLRHTNAKFVFAGIVRQKENYINSTL
jgi:hypothetical protein